MLQEVNFKFAFIFAILTCWKKIMNSKIYEKSQWQEISSTSTLWISYWKTALLWSILSGNFGNRRSTNLLSNIVFSNLPFLLNIPWSSKRLIIRNGSSLRKVAYYQSWSKSLIEPIHYWNFFTVIGKLLLNFNSQTFTKVSHYSCAHRLGLVTN